MFLKILNKSERCWNLRHLVVAREIVKKKIAESIALGKNPPRSYGSADDDSENEDTLDESTESSFSEGAVGGTTEDDLFYHSNDDQLNDTASGIEEVYIYIYIYNKYLITAVEWCIFVLIIIYIYI